VILLLSQPARSEESGCSEKVKQALQSRLPKRAAFARPSDDRPVIRVSLRNQLEKSSAPTELLIALDGVIVFLKCRDVGGEATKLFYGPAEPGTHFLDTIATFGGARLYPASFRVRAGMVSRSFSLVLSPNRSDIGPLLFYRIEEL